MHWSAISEINYCNCRDLLDAKLSAFWFRFLPLLSTLPSTGYLQTVRMYLWFCVQSLV